MNKQAYTDLSQNSKNKAIPFIVLIVFVLLSLFVSVTHEPWFDEAQAWMIARDASYHDIIFYLTHYEGHPPFWWLILSVPAKLGCDYEISLKVIMLLVSTSNAAIVIFKSPFKSPVKYLLPFGYWFFYEYGILARPYGLYITGFLLMAVTFAERNSRPWKFVLSMFLACGMTAYGIVLCGGICLAWCIEIFEEHRKDLSKIFTDKRVWLLALLLLFVVFIVYLIYPYPDVFSVKNSVNVKHNSLKTAYFVLFMLPSSALVLGNVDFSYGGFSFGIAEVISMTVLSLIIVLLILKMCYERRIMKYYILPMILFSVFCGIVYFTSHHEGIVVPYLVFILWIAQNTKRDDNKNIIDRIKSDVLRKQLSDERIKKLPGCILTGIIAIQCIWSVPAVITDVSSNYYYSRECSDFIKANNLENMNILCSFTHYGDLDDPSLVQDNICTSDVPVAVSVDPYFKSNIFKNLNKGDKNKGYLIRSSLNSIDEDNIAYWSGITPDLLIDVSSDELEYIYGNKYIFNDFVLVKEIEYKKGSKLSYIPVLCNIYMRKDLYETQYKDKLVY